MEYINNILQNFEFIRPVWLLAIIAVVIVYALKLKYGQSHNLWRQLLPQHLYQKLIIAKGLGKPNRFIHTAMLAWVLACIALAGPSWEKLPQAVYQTQAGKVLLMDMSMSMRATDISPNRLTRTRFKAIDLLQQLNEGETGLIAYSGDAFVISPLTDDTNTLANLIPSLSPEIMPTKGSSALSGLQNSAELLKGAGYQSGDIYWLTDGINFDEIQSIRSFIQQSPYTVSALLIGTEEGAPIQLLDGKLLKDYSGSIVVPSINERYMQQAMAGTPANFSLFANDNSDISKIKRKVDFEQQQQAEKVENTSGDTLKDMGPFVVLLLLPVAAYAFRKGLLFFTGITLTAGLSFGSLYPSTAYAQQDASSIQNPQSQTAANASSDAGISEPVEQNSLFSRWFKNADQRGKQAYDAQNFEQANQLFNDPQWQAASAYKKGDYESAANLYKTLPGVDNTYNLANALAKQMKLEEALDAYNEVLASQSDHAQALKNKALVEEMIKQQEQSEQQNQQSDEQNQQGQDGDNSEEQQDSQGEQQNQDQQGEQGNDSQSSENGQPSDDNTEQSEQDSSQQQQQDDRSLEDEAQQQNQAQENDATEAENSEGQQGEASESSEPQQEETSSEANAQENDMQNPEQAQQEAVSNAQFQMENLSPEQQEEMQRMQMILNKVPDDPAYLLQRKMLLEAHRRKNTPAPPTQENW